MTRSCPSTPRSSTRWSTGRHGNPHDDPRRRTRTTAPSPSARSSRWPTVGYRSSLHGEARRSRACSTSTQGIWVGVFAGTPTSRTTGSRSTYGRGAPRWSRRHLALPAHDRRDRPPPDQRGPARAALAGAGRARARTTGGRHRRLRGLGAARQGGPGPRRLQQLGRQPHPLRQVGDSGVWEPFVPGVGRGRLQVPHPRRRRRVARQGRPDGVLHRGPAGHRLAGLRDHPHSGPTTSG